jgi:hypothetical protein
LSVVAPQRFNVVRSHGLIAPGRVTYKDKADKAENTKADKAD